MKQKTLEELGWFSPIEKTKMRYATPLVACKTCGRDLGELVRRAIVREQVEWRELGATAGAPALARAAVFAVLRHQGTHRRKKR